MNGKRAKALRRLVTGDPDQAGRLFHTAENETTQVLHPESYRKQYLEAKKNKKGGV
jgi:hypothetical protein